MPGVHAPAPGPSSHHNRTLLLRVAGLLAGLALALGLLASPAAAYDTQKVVLVIIDGLRYTEGLGHPSRAYTPQMDAISAGGTVIEPFRNDGYTYTSRAVPAIWCGGWTEMTGFNDPDCGGQWNYHSEMPSIFEYYRKQLGRPATDCVYVLKDLCSWKGSLDPDYGSDYWPLYHTAGSTDLDVWHQAENVLDGLEPSFMLLYLADVDHAGHSGDWTAYLNAIAVADSIVGLLWNHLQTDPVYAGVTTMLVTNDHGRHTTDFTGHGDGCEGCRTIQLLAVGPDIREGFVSTTSRAIPDIVPTIGELLGFTADDATGSVMDEILRDVTAVEEPPVSREPILQVLGNPTRGSTEIFFRLPQAGIVRAAVYDVRGREVTTLLSGRIDAGPHRLVWDGTHADGTPAGAGVYFVSVRSETFAASRRVVFLR